MAVSDLPRRSLCIPFTLLLVNNSSMGKLECDSTSQQMQTQSKKERESCVLKQKRPNIVPRPVLAGFK